MTNDATTKGVESSVNQKSLRVKKKCFSWKFELLYSVPFSFCLRSLSIARSLALLYKISSIFIVLLSKDFDLYYFSVCNFSIFGTHFIPEWSQAQTHTHVSNNNQQKCSLLLLLLLLSRRVYNSVKIAHKSRIKV